MDGVISTVGGMYLLVSEAHDLEAPVPDMPADVGLAAAPEICYVASAQIDDGERVTLSVAVFDHEPDTRPWDDFWKWKASATMQTSAPVWVASLAHDHIERITDTGGTYNVVLYARPYEYVKQNPDEPAEVHFLVLWPRD